MIIIKLEFCKFEFRKIYLEIVKIKFVNRHRFLVKYVVDLSLGIIINCQGYTFVNIVIWL